MSGVAAHSWRIIHGIIYDCWGTSSAEFNDGAIKTWRIKELQTVACD